MDSEDISNELTEEEKGSRLAAILAATTLEDEPEEILPVVPKPKPAPTTTDKLEEILKSSETIRGTARKAEAVQTVGPEQESFLVEVLENVSNLQNLLEDIIEQNPIFKTHIIILTKLVSEYERLDDQIDAYMVVITGMLGVKLSGERSRVRDNLTQLVIERWRLLNSILDNVNKLQNNLMKIKAKDDKETSDQDLFSGYAKYAEERNNESSESEES